MQASRPPAAPLHHAACDLLGCRSHWTVKGEAGGADVSSRESREHLGGETALASGSVKRFSLAEL